LSENDVPCERINKMNESRPNIVDAIMSREIQMVINTPVGRWSKVDDSYIRKSAIRFQVPYMTTLAAALASVKGIAAQRQSKSTVRSLQDYHRGLE
jgi:carbamoyl-phosphate synthase large subunit